MSVDNPVYGFLRPGSRLFETRFRDSLGQYARRILDELSRPALPPPVASLWENARELHPSVIYDGLCQLQDLLMPEQERLSLDPRMSKSVAAS